MYSIPLISDDVSDEEVEFRVFQAMEMVRQTAGKIFEKCRGRVKEIENMTDDINRRSDVIAEKLEVLKNSKSLIVLEIPETLPKTRIKPSISLFDLGPGLHTATESVPIEKYSSSQIFEPTSARNNEKLDIKREIQDRKKFFMSTEVLKEVRAKRVRDDVKKAQKSLRKLPRNNEFITDLFYFGTTIPAYEGVGGGDSQDVGRSISSRRSKEEREQHEIMLEDTALSSGLLHDVYGFVDDGHPLAFRPDNTPTNDISFPESLTGLSGIAENFSTFRDTLTSLNKPVIQFPEDILPFSKLDLVSEPSTSIPEVAYAPVSMPESELISSIPPPPPMIIPTVAPTAIPPPPILPASIPPPPPPPPMAVVQTTTKVVSSVVVDDGRSDLMAAIRAAGGASKAQLKSVTETEPKTRRKGKYDGLLETSALGSTKSDSSAGGDLMSALSKALDARRKAISGKNDRVSPSKSSIPAPPNFTDEDWA